MRLSKKDKFSLVIVFLFLFALIVGVIANKIPKTIFNKAAEPNAGIFPYPTDAGGGAELRRTPTPSYGSSGGSPGGGGAVGFNPTSTPSWGGLGSGATNTPTPKPKPSNTPKPKPTNTPKPPCRYTCLQSSLCSAEEGTVVSGSCSSGKVCCKFD